jgi:hypothetical protein
MCGLQQARQFRGGNQGDVRGAFPPDDDYFLIVDYAIQRPREVLPQAGVGGFNGHPMPLLQLYRKPVRIVTDAR